MDVFTKIQEALKAQGKTQKELAQYLGISQAAFTNWKSGLNDAYLKYLPQIAEFLEVSVDYLLGRTENPSPLGHGAFRIWKEFCIHIAKGYPVVLQELIDDSFAKFCVQYGGSGKYLPELGNTIDYLNMRWALGLDEETLLKKLESIPIVDIASRPINWKKEYTHVGQYAIAGQSKAPASAEAETGDRGRLMEIAKNLAPEDLQRLLDHAELLASRHRQ